MLANFVLTEGRAAAAFAQPVAYARSFFNRDAVASYGPEDSAGARVISIQIDAETGERRIDTLQLQSAPAAALRPDVMGAAAQDSMGALGAPRVQPSATPTRTAVPSGAPRQP